MIDTIIFLWLGALTTAVALLGVPRIKFARKDRPPKPPKPYVCPHGNISTLAVYIINGQKRTLCKYCYNKEGGVSDVLALPRL